MGLLPYAVCHVRIYGTERVRVNERAGNVGLAHQRQREDKAAVVAGVSPLQPR